MNNTTVPSTKSASNVDQDDIEKDGEELIVPNTTWGTNFLHTSTHQDEDGIAAIATAEIMMGMDEIHNNSTGNKDSNNRNSDDGDSNNRNSDDGVANNDAADADAVERVKTAEQYLAEKGNNRKVLFAMLNGVYDPEEKDLILGELDFEPYKSASKKNSFTPTNIDLRNEVVRRFHRYNQNPKSKLPHPKFWPKNKILDWLAQCPITCETDKAFLIQQEREVRDVQAKINEEKEATKLSSLEVNDSRPKLIWSEEMILRLCHCLSNDDVREAYIKRFDALNRDELDARDSSTKPPTVEETIAKTMNDVNYNPVSEFLPDLHGDFGLSRELSYDIMPRDITADEVKTKLADIKVKLFKIMNDWERSGNGDGNKIDKDGERCVRDHTDVNFGHFDVDDMEFKNDNRSSFLGKNKPSLLYFWHFADKYQIIPSSITSLDSNQAANSTSIASTEYVQNSRKNKRKGNPSVVDDNETNFFAEAIGNISLAELTRTLSDERRSLYQLKKESLAAPVGSEEKELADEMCRFTQSNIDRIEERIKQFELNNA